MTKIKNNAILQGLSGKLGKTHSYRNVRGKTQMVNLPPSGRVATGDQKKVTERFTKAARYAKSQIMNEEMKALYITGITDKKHNAYLVAVSDSLNPPKVGEIRTTDYLGAVGDEIVIIATDDFKVVRVRVIITDTNGGIVEHGEAVQDVKNSDAWKYTATVANAGLKGTTISVSAFDMPDNETTLAKVL